MQTRKPNGHDWVIKELDWTPKQKVFIDLFMRGVQHDGDEKRTRTKCVMVEGPAGTSKTMLAVLVSLFLLRDKRTSSVVYGRPLVESSSRSMGLLPGEISAKIGPFMAPLKEKLDILLPAARTNELLEKDLVRFESLNFLRGREFHNQTVIFDEVQNATIKELLTLMTRIGDHSRLILLGDCMQSDIPDGQHGNHFRRLMTMFSTQEAARHGIQTFRFTAEDIVRDPFVRFVIETAQSHDVTC